ncbi:MAG: hypothetical protein LBC80_01515 [Treponema sp.]|jgi:hypothetical protein|nr:hypothetical protein [Treponema sp.]
MVLFCLLWVPLFYLLRRSFSQGGGSGVWALLLGSITAMLQYNLGDFVSPGGFGFSRVLYGFVDIVSLTVFIPLVFCFLISLFKGFSQEIDFANFTLLWLIPVGALRALGWSTTNNPILLVVTPLLWTALAVGIPYFINLMLNNLRLHMIIFNVLLILLLPVLACTTYWAFFSHHTLIGFILLIVANVPLVISLVFARR